MSHNYGMRTLIYPVQDLPRAKALYGALLGVAPTMDEPYYVGYRVGDQEIGLDPHGHAQGMTGPTGYWHVADIHASYDQLLAAGAEPVLPIADVGGGKRIAAVKDGDGNLIGLIQAP